MEADKERVVVVAVGTLKEGGEEGCMNVVARTIDEKRCEEWLGFSESLSPRERHAAKWREAGASRVQLGGCCMHRDTPTTSSSPLLFLRLQRSLHPSPHHDPHPPPFFGGKTKRQIVGKYRFLCPRIFHFEFRSFFLSYRILPEYVDSWIDISLIKLA